MHRRALLIGTAAGAACPAWAQGRRPLIAILEARPAPPQGDSANVASLRAALGAVDLRDGQRVDIVVRYGTQTAELDAAARALVDAKPAVILTLLTPAGHAARRATTSIPIVLAGVADPVGSGLVDSLARPGGNITGITALGSNTAAKTLQILREWLPGSRRVGALLNATDPFTPLLRASLQEAARNTRFELLEVLVEDPATMAATFADWSARRIDAVFVQPSLPLVQAAQIGLRQRLPVFSFVHLSTQPGAGGLFSYGASLPSQHQKVADYVRRILDGARPADLPVQQPDRYDLMINAATARTLGLPVPTALRIMATEVID